MQIRHAVGQEQYARMSTQELRRHFLVENVFVSGRIALTYWETERTVLGGAVPVDGPLRLETDPALAAEYFCERRELGAFNLGGAGAVVVDDEALALETHDAVYIGRGSREVRFSSVDPGNPARFYLVSYPAHAAHPTRLLPRSSANRIDLGEQATANQRTLYQFIHEGGARSCQLVTGFTRLKAGNVWNTMPPHTHLRRSEVYFYFDVPANAAVFHFMGPQEETRHLVVTNGQAVLSPVWSIHAGCGSQDYSFVWAMGGENQRFSDMDGIRINDLR